VPLEPTAEVIRFVAGRYGLPVDGTASMRLVARGAMGKVWRLDTGLGPSVAVKELLWGGREQSVRDEAAFQDAATEHGSVRAPANHRTVDGLYLCQLPPELGSGLVRVLGWVDGSSLTGPDLDAARWLGATLGALHHLGHPGGGAAPDPWYWRCPSEPDWHDLVAAASDARWLGDLRAALPRLRELSAGVAPDEGPHWIYCHGDLQLSNVLTDGSGRFTLIDWENAGPGTPERELAASLLSWRLDHDLLRVALAAYRRAGGPVRTLSPAAFSLAAAVRVNYVYVQARAALDEALTAELREHADRECARSVVSLPDPQRLVALRDAINAGLRGR
jgi:Ser/Thr protein kinase RdoA (MazF antagonist)